MKKFMLLVICAITGCAPMIEAEIGLIDQSRKGVAMVSDSVAARREMIRALLQKDRAALDAAFDEDVIEQSEIDSSWVIEARRAYAVALDALVRRDEAADRSIDADLDNLNAIDDALIELERLNQQQAQWFQRLNR